MSVGHEILGQLQRLTGLSAAAPQTVEAADNHGIRVELDVVAVDRVGCASRELRIRNTGAGAVSAATLRDQADNICRKATYLLEPLAVLETDPEHSEILIRSVTPDRQGADRRYYELRLRGSGDLQLRRYAATSGVPGRTTVDLETTKETTRKLVDDLVTSIGDAA